MLVSCSGLEAHLIGYMEILLTFLRLFLALRTQLRARSCEQLMSSIILPICLLVFGVSLYCTITPLVFTAAVLMFMQGLSHI